MSGQNIPMRQTHGSAIRPQDRRGAVAVLAALMMMIFIGMVAFSIDYGYIQAKQAQMQRSADAAVLAAVQDLIPDANGVQDFNRTRATVRSYVGQNLDETGFTIQSADIEIGRFDPATVYTNLTLLNSGVHDAVRVTLRRDGASNPLLPLFFARALGVDTANVTVRATAVLQKPMYLPPGAGVLPFAVPVTEWTAVPHGDTWTIYGDGNIEDDFGNSVPGNWGTLDIGSDGNSTSDIRDQIENGLDQSHLDHLYADGRISTDQYIDTSQTTWLNADTGLSSGMKSAIQNVYGQTRIIPLFDSSSGAPGNNLEFEVVSWAIVTVGDSRFNGANNTYVKVQKASIYEGLLTPNNDLRSPSSVEGAFTSPVLVE